MNRAIKFRAWDKKEEEFVYFDVIGGLSEECDETYRQLNMLKPQQYTGLKDLKGKEIYDGDIVDIVDEGRHITNLIIKYDNYLCGFIMENNEWRKRFYRVEYIEVIGNIHENKDLLT